jgi:DNA-directed RNA polymerase alpha subunit
LGELVQKSEQELLLIPNSGLKTLNEVKEILSGFKLQLGQPITNWPPRNLEQLSLRVDNLLEPVEYLELSIRTANCLRDETIQFVGELVQISEDDMLKKT